jgi:hypothetical protein
MQIFVEEHDGHSCNCVVTINCLPMSMVDVFLPQLCAAVPQYFQPHFCGSKMTEAIFGLRLSIRRQTGKSYDSQFTTSEQCPANMDMPMNVPVDDPNADTEWYKFLLFRQMGGS